MSIFSRFILKSAASRFEEMRRVLAVPEDKVATKEVTTSDSAASPTCKPESTESVTPQLPLRATLAPVRVGVATKKPIKPDSTPQTLYSTQEKPTYVLTPTDAATIIPVLISGNEPVKLQTSRKYTPPEYLEGFGTYLDDGTPYFGDFSYKELNGLPEVSQRNIMNHIFHDPNVQLDATELNVAMRFETHLDHSGQWISGEEI